MPGNDVGCGCEHIPFTAKFLLLESLDFLFERFEDIISSVMPLGVTDYFTFTAIDSRGRIGHNNVDRLLRVEPFKCLGRCGGEFDSK